MIYYQCEYCSAQKEAVTEGVPDGFTIHPRDWIYFEVSHPMLGKREKRVVCSQPACLNAAWEWALTIARSYIDDKRENGGNARIEVVESRAR